MPRTVAFVIIGLLLGQHGASGQTAKSSSKGMERAIVFAVENEVKTSHLEKNRDVCLVLATSLKPYAQPIFFDLAHDKVQIHSDKWCKSKLAGYEISVLGSVKETSPDRYQFSLGVGKLATSDDGHDSATPVRRGKYVIQIQPHPEPPQLISYEQSCCSSLAQKP